jgi:hypothetical protein
LLGKQSRRNRRHSHQSASHCETSAHFPTFPA